MASAIKNLSEYNDANLPSAEGLKIGIVVADWHQNITHNLYRGCFDTLIKHGVVEEDIETIQVPGAFELPYAAKVLAGKLKLDAIVCLGCVIRGETKHNDYINHAVASGITQLSMLAGLPVIYGVLTPNDEQQAIDRSGGKYGNKGIEAAVTAIRMARIKETIGEQDNRIGF